MIFTREKLYRKSTIDLINKISYHYYETEWKDLKKETKKYNNIIDVNMIDYENENEGCRGRGDDR